MNHFTVAIIATALFPFCALADEIQHTVTAAAVFSDRAILTRTGTAKLKSGKNEIVFAGIRNNIDLRSIRVGTNIPDGIEILGISWERHVSKTIDNTKIAKLEKRLSELETQRIRFNDERSADKACLETAQTYLVLVQKMIAEQSTGKAPADVEKSWTHACETLDSEIAKIYARETEIASELLTVNAEIAQIREEIETLSGHGNVRKTLSLIVTLTAEKEMEATIPVSYTTHSANWTPRYDARISEANKTVDLTYAAMIRQMTGEPWENVTLVLSTAQPQVSARPPKTPSIALAGKTVDPNLQQFVQAEQQIASNRALTEMRSQHIEVVEKFENEALNTNAFSTVQTQGASATFAINGTYTISQGEKAYQVAIAEKTFPNVDLTYESAPVLRGGIYLRANVKNETPYPILPGEVSIYRQSGFIGKSAMKYTPVGSRLSFFAGTIDGISSAITVAPKYQESNSKFFSSSGTNTFAGETYTFANLTETPRKVRVRSQIQVSEVDDIKISILEKPIEHILATTPGYVLEKDTGLIYWDVELPANSETKLVLSTKTEKK